MTTPYPDNENWPVDYQGGTVTGKYIATDGTVVSGTITFTTPQIVIVPLNGMVVVPKDINVSLDEEGAFSVVLPATNDPDIQPWGWTYTVTENLDTQNGRTFYMEVPQGQTTDISTVAPVAQSLGTVTYIGPAIDLALVYTTGDEPSASLTEDTPGHYTIHLVLSSGGGGGTGGTVGSDGNGQLTITSGDDLTVSSDSAGTLTLVGAGVSTDGNGQLTITEA
jgi:hypothetical protein